MYSGVAPGEERPREGVKNLAASYAADRREETNESD